MEGEKPVPPPGTSDHGDLMPTRSLSNDHVSTMSSFLASASRSSSVADSVNSSRCLSEREADKEAQAAAVCRYCLEGEPHAELVRPCLCTSPVHRSCLTRWIQAGENQSQRSLECEVCRGGLQVSFVPAPLSALFSTADGRRLLASGTLRLLYRIFLMRKLTPRWRNLAERWAQLVAFKRLSARSFFGGIMAVLCAEGAAALLRDSLLGALLASITAQMFVRDAQSLHNSLAHFRDSNGTLCFDGGAKRAASGPAAIAGVRRGGAGQLAPTRLVSLLAWLRPPGEPGASAGRADFLWPAGMWLSGLQGARVVGQVVHLRVNMSL